MAKIDSVKQTKKSPLKTVSFRTRVADAKEVTVTGDFTGWSKEKVRLTKDAKGEWSGVLELAPGEYQYRLLVDGEWRDDPLAQARVPNQFGSSNCVLKVQA
jgi:1,4-alpha-glucan branching enzyme